jgi:hypothetical protein
MLMVHHQSTRGLLCGRVGISPECIGEVFGSYVILVTRYPEMGFSWFVAVKVNVGVVPSKNPKSLPVILSWSSSETIHDLRFSRWWLWKSLISWDITPCSSVKRTAQRYIPGDKTHLRILFNSMQHFKRKYQETKEWLITITFQSYLQTLVNFKSFKVFRSYGSQYVSANMAIIRC